MTKFGNFIVLCLHCGFYYFILISSVYLIFSMTHRLYSKQIQFMDYSSLYKQQYIGKYVEEIIMAETNIPNIRIFVRND